MSDHNKVFVNNKEEQQIRKVKVPLTVDWQKMALEKQKEFRAKGNEEKINKS